MSEVCSGCLSTGRTMYYINDTIYYNSYIQCIPLNSGVDIFNLSIRICWECKAMFDKFENFKHKVQAAFRIFTEGVFLDVKPSSALKICHLDYNEYTESKDGDVKDEDGQDIELEVKIEPVEHDEPQTFVKDFKIVNEPKVKSKKKTKEKKLKLRKKKEKKRKHEQSPSPSINNDSFDCPVDMSDVGSDCDIPINKIKEDLPIEDNNLGEEKTEETETETTVKTIRRRSKGEKLPEKPQCAECGKIFSTAKTYRRHIEVVHNGRNKYPCPHCDRVYRWNSNLHRHIRSHKAQDADELYCVTCDKRYSSIATFRQHLTASKRHVPVEQFTFICNECGKKFVSKTNLKDHIDWEHLKRVKFRCKVCDKPFKTHTSRYLHVQNVHTHESRRKSNLCHICGKRYQNSAKLKSHIIAIHTSHTPYRCGKCSAAFSWHSSLYRHLKEIHHKIKPPYGVKKSKKPPQMLPALGEPPIMLPVHTATT